MKKRTNNPTSTALGIGGGQNGQLNGVTQIGKKRHSLNDKWEDNKTLYSSFQPQNHIDHIKLTEYKMIVADALED